MKSIVAINTSPRSEGNTAMAVKYFMDSIKEDNKAAYYDLNEYTIGYCNGELKCEKFGRCTQKDDWQIIEEDLYEANVIIIGTPVFMGHEVAQFKTFLERCRSFLSYIEAIDPTCNSIKELFEKHSNLRDNWPEPISRIKKHPEVNIIITQSQPDKRKHTDLILYLEEIISKVFNTKNVNVYVLTSKLNKDDFEKGKDFWRFEK